MSDIDEYVEYLLAGINNAIDEALDETATIVVADTKLTTPVKTGSLKRSWTHGEVKTNGTNKKFIIFLKQKAKKN